MSCNIAALPGIRSRSWTGFVDGTPLENFNGAATENARPNYRNRHRRMDAADDRVRKPRSCCMSKRPTYRYRFVRRALLPKVSEEKVTAAPCYKLVDEGPSARLLLRPRLIDYTGELKHAVLLSFKQMISLIWAE